MTEEEYLSKLQEGLAEAAPVPSALLELSDEAVLNHPTSSQLWLLRGHLVQLGEGDPRWTVDDAVSSYESALALAPDDPEVHEALGYWYDVVDIQLERAACYFASALAKGGGRDSYLGMARVLAEQGKKSEALRVLEPGECPFQEEPEVRELFDAIQEGHWEP